MQVNMMWRCNMRKKKIKYGEVSHKMRYHLKNLSKWIDVKHPPHGKSSRIPASLDEFMELGQVLLDSIDMLIDRFQNW